MDQIYMNTILDEFVNMKETEYIVSCVSRYYTIFDHKEFK